MLKAGFAYDAFRGTVCSEDLVAMITLKEIAEINVINSY